MVEVFKTQIKRKQEAEIVEVVLKKELGYSNIAFDLDDCDHILRIEAEDVAPHLVVKLLARLNIACQVLAD